MSKPSYALVWVYSSQLETHVCYHLKADEHTEDSPLTIYEDHRQHEEGWAYSKEMLWMDDDGVHFSEETDGVDCDGRMQTFQEHVTKYDPFDPCFIKTRRLEVGDCDSDHPLFLPFKVPAWEEAKSSQRDFSAEAAGY